MKKIVSFLVLVMLLFSCKDELVEKPDRLIDKKVMENIIYDMSLLEAIKYNQPNTSMDYRVNPKEFIYKKYKVDSAQFAQNNVYYASDFEGYKEMYDNVVKRIDDKKRIVDSLVKIEVRRDSLIEAKRRRLDSIKAAKKAALTKKDSLQKVKKKDSLLLLKKTPKKRQLNTAAKKVRVITNGVKAN